MLHREDLYKRLIYLVPDAKFSFWPDEGNNDNKGYENTVKIPGWVIAWYPENSHPLPTLEQINLVDESTLASWIVSRRKDARDAQKATDLGIVAAYEIAKTSNPTLSFRDYLDNLEQISISIKEALV